MLNYQRVPVMCFSFGHLDDDSNIFQHQGGSESDIPGMGFS
jgi:hypothetical protein